MAPGHEQRRGRGRRLRRPPPGSSPGTLLAEPEAPPPGLRLFAYRPQTIVETRLVDVAGLEAASDGAAVVWLDVAGLGDVHAIRRIGERFGLHLLVIEDVVHAGQRPKAEIHGEHLFLILRMPRLQDGHLVLEQLALVVGDGFVLTFQEWPGDCFDPVRERLRHGRGRIRAAGADYLAYALIDALVDSCFPVLEHYGESLERLEQDILEAPDAALIGQIHTVKRDLLELRRNLWPLREVIALLMREDTPFVTAPTRPFLRDCADHVFQLMDMLEIDREVASGLIELHLSSVGMRTNEIMKVLTVIATIFIPLGFIAGVYGMNFDPEVSPFNMPELEWYLGYPFALVLMAAVAFGLLAWFRRKGWIGGASKRR
jgi:magnesium transporter